MSDELAPVVTQTDLDAVPAEDVEIQKQHTPVQNTIGSNEFNEALGKELCEGKLWRTSIALAKKFNVDPIELDKFLRAQPAVCSRQSNKEGIFLYSLLKRLEQPQEKKVDPKVEQAMRPLVTEEDRYVLGSLHSAFILLEAALQKYALKIHERNSEAFTNLVGGKDKVEAGIALFANRIKADVTKLPKL